MDLLILGAAVRPAAWSALRIGLQPTCVDLFADVDLASACRATRIEPADYPDGLLAFADRSGPTDWLYTGAMENRPDLVDAISRRHRLLGNPAATLRAVRDPLALAGAARAAGLVAPEVRLDPAGLPRDGSWLRKPIASAAGRGIRPWLAGTKVDDRRPCYFQRRVDGLGLASIHVGDGSGARLLGITRQLVGRPGNPFAYRGSIGPWPVGPEVRDRVDRLGRAVASASGLVGIFGIDLILRDGHAWPIEVNPRYTASVEVLEWALGRSLLADHLASFGRVVRPSDPHPPAAPGFVGKAIVHAGGPATWPGLGDRIVDLAPTSFPEIADVPQPGTAFRPGDPVLTVFARGETYRACRDGLDARAARWRPG